MRDHVVQLTGDARPLPAGRVLHQGAGDGLPGRTVHQRLAARPLRDPGQGGRRGQRGQQHDQDVFLGARAPAVRPAPAPGTARPGPGARNWAAPHEASVRRLPLRAAPLRPSRYKAISSAARPATVSVWKAASESTLAAQIATAAATGPRKASGTVVLAASAHTPTRPTALIPVPAPRAIASVIAASPAGPRRRRARGETRRTAGPFPAIRRSGHLPCPCQSLSPLSLGIASPRPGIPPSLLRGMRRRCPSCQRRRRPLPGVTTVPGAVP